MVDFSKISSGGQTTPTPNFLPPGVWVIQLKTKMFYLHSEVGGLFEGVPPPQKKSIAYLTVLDNVNDTVNEILGF